MSRARENNVEWVSKYLGADSADALQSGWTKFGKIPDRYLIIAKKIFASLV